MPCVGAVFMYRMLVVAGDSWWSIPLNVCVLCGHTHFRFSFKLIPVLDLKWKYLSSAIFSKLMTSQSVGCLTHFSIQGPKCPQEDKKGSKAAFLDRSAAGRE